jgi:prolyl-tRNA synthetase
MMDYAIKPTRNKNFSDWYLRVVAEADLAVNSPVRGCMIIRPNGFGIWERIQYLLNKRIEDTGHENLYFPIFIPLAFLRKEAEIAEGFAKEMAVVTHHRLKVIDGELSPDPDALLPEPLVVRPTSETIIGHHFSESIQSYRDLPLLWNQWANVVRWEMRTRLFLRTSEFLWQEGHTAHADRDEAMAETMRMLEVYRSFAHEVLAMPVIAGEKPVHERFPGAERTFSIEAMMWDGRALQAGTSHYLGTHFAEAQDIKYQTKSGGLAYCHTTSWGVSTRLIGGMIMTHGDDDGLRAPPRIAPRQIVIVPILRNKTDDSEILDYCDRLATELRASSFADEPIRVLVDRRDAKSVDKRWTWIKRGAPVICEIGGRDILHEGSVTFLRRDKLRDGNRLVTHKVSRQRFVDDASKLLQEIQDALYVEAKDRVERSIITHPKTIMDVYQYFDTAAETREPDGGLPARGWVRASWKRPQGTESQQIEAALKERNLTIRNAPLGQNPPFGQCIFTGSPADEEILIARAY